MAISSVLGSSALLPAGLGFRNVLINGDFKVWQRGTSFTWSSGQPYTADRWCITPAGAAAFSASRQTASLDRFQYCLRLQRTSGDTNTSGLNLSQPVETVTSIPLANKQVVLSFYARAGANYSPTSSLMGVKLVTGTGTDGNFLVATLTGQATPLDTTVTLTTSWQRFSFLVPISSTANQVQPDFYFNPIGTAGAADYFEITGVQLEQNFQPTPFEQRPIGVELALCQRYYWRTYGSGTLSDLFGSGIPNNTTTAYIGVPHPVEMRTAATSLDFNAQVTDLNNDWNTTGSSIYSGNKRSTTVRVTEGAYFTAFRPIFVNLNATSRYIGLSAEL
jgi:hypothetical protein